VLKRLSYRINTAIGRYLPEQRLFLKSDTETRFIRLPPVTQAIALAGGGVVVGWTIVATSILLMDSISAGSGHDQALRQQTMFENRLNALSADRDQRADDAARAQERFNLALAEVSKMQTRLLASEDSRRELETGVEVIQDTLRRTIKERDEAQGKSETLAATLRNEPGALRSPEARAYDAMATVEILSTALAGTAGQRDSMAVTALAARDETDRIASEKQAMETRNDLIFSKLEDAVTISMEPLDKMFRAAGLSPDDLLKSVRRGYSGQGGPLGPFSLSTKGESLGNDELRANAILQGLDRMNLYRLAAVKAPFAIPVKAAFRYTSGFGWRNDPKGAGRRMHSGTDMAGPQGTPIYSTADGVVTKAGWSNGYGRHVEIKHDFGIVTTYSHMSAIYVQVGQRVSRGSKIGGMGNSGRSTGTHLHYEVQIGGKPVNPVTFIKAARDVF
tara:strand:+ start:2846 stop:4186 length:1341 start_codon:yes stop_codon:yes gene_type:complete